MNFIEYVKQLWKNGPGGGTPWSASPIRTVWRMELRITIV